MAYSDHFYADKPDGIPDDHWAIVVFSQTWVPGDERSRTNPGHGYPEHYESTVKYIVFKDRESWEAEIKRRMTLVYGDKFIAIQAKKARVTSHVTFSVETEVK